jgi:hypothetical protein
MNANGIQAPAPELKPRTADPELCTTESELRTAESGVRTAELELRTTESGVRTAELELRTAGPEAALYKTAPGKTALQRKQ